MLREATLEEGSETGGAIPSPSSLLLDSELGTSKMLSMPHPIHTHACPHSFPPTALESPLHPCPSLGHPNVPLSRPYLPLIHFP